MLRKQIIWMPIYIISVVELYRLTDPSCRCYIFSSKMNKTGLFKSPNFPRSYPTDITCILYRFEGLSTELVKINFYTFRLPEPEKKRCTDYVDLFTSINVHSKSFAPTYETRNHSAVTTAANRAADYRLCGQFASLPQTVFYSLESILILVLHAVPVVGKTRRVISVGFSGQYEFENRDQYKIDGILRPGTTCTYHFNQTSTKIIKRGKFYSPFYPTNCPSGLHCTYNFWAAPDHRIVLTFQSINLNNHIQQRNHKIGLCSISESQETYKDIVNIYESNNDSHPKYLARICGRVQNIQIVSHGQQLIVELVTRVTPFQSRGFQATYEFARALQLIPTPYMDLESPTERLFQDQFQKHDSNQVTRMLASRSREGVANLAEQINEPEQFSTAHIPIFETFIIKSGQGNLSKSGYMYSPLYPSPYPASIDGVVIFEGQRDEVVVLELFGMRLKSSDRCLNVEARKKDILEIFDGRTVFDSRLSALCVPESIEEHKLTDSKFTSSGRYLTLRFQSDIHTGPLERGFTMRYRFENKSRWLSLDNDRTRWISTYESTNTQATAHRLRSIPQFLLGLWFLLLSISANLLLIRK